MILAGTADKLTRAQRARWDGVVETCRKAYESTKGSNPLLCHGTTAMRAAHILRNGFEATPAYTFTHGDTGVHWGVPHHRGCGRWAAEDAMEADDPPVMLMARLSDILASGAPAPDAFILNELPDDVSRLDWRHTLEEGGAFVMVGGRHVANMTLLDLGDLPLHPRAVEVRRARLAGTHAEVRPGRLPFAIPEGFAFTPDTRFATPDDVDLGNCRVYGPGGAPPAWFAKAMRDPIPAVIDEPDRAGPRM